MSTTALETILDAHLPAWAEREHEADRQDQRRLPADTIQDFRRSGVLAAAVPRAQGGGGVELFELAQALRRIARQAPSTALCLAMPLGNAGNTRIPFDAVERKVRPELEQGRAWIAQKAICGSILGVANSEPGGGGDILATRTRARRDGSGTLRLSGQKSFATLGPDADYFLCSARLDDGTLDAFFVARDAQGVRLSDDWNALGMRATASVGLVLENAAAESVFMYPGAITRTNARHWSTLLMAAVFVGVGEGALHAAAQCAPTNSAWARASLAECALRLDAASAFVELLARLDTMPCTAAHAERCRRAKNFGAQVALETATRAVMVSGGRAYQPDHPVARLLLHAAAGPLLRPPLPQTMDGIAAELFAGR